MSETSPPADPAPRSRRRLVLARAAALLLAVALLATLVVWLQRADEPGRGATSAPGHAAEPPAETPAPGRAPGRAAGTAAPAESAVAGPFAIEGRVVGDDGAGLGEVTLEVIGPDGVVATIESELDGGFRTGPLPLELYAVRARREGYAEALLADVVPGGPGLVVALRPGRAIALRVAPADVAASCHLGGAGLFPPRRVESDGGSCLFDGLPPGHYQVFATAPGRGSRIHALELAANGAVGTPPTLELAPATDLEVEVGHGRDDAFVGLAGALVTVSAEPLHVLAVHEVSDGLGRVRFDGLHAGIWYVSVRAPGYLPQAPRAVRLPRDAPLVVAPDPGVTVSGRVVDEAGVGVPLAELVARVETPDGAHWLVERDNLDVLNRLVRRGGTSLGRPRTSFRSGGDGQFALGGLPQGKVRLEARKEGWVALERAATIELDAQGSARGVELRLTRGGTLIGRVVGPGGGGLSGASVRWRLPGDDVWGWREVVTANARGEFVLSGVAPQIELEAAAAGYATRLVGLGRDADDAARTVQLEPVAGTIVGRLLGPSGVVVGAELRRAATGLDPLACMGETDREGRFELLGCGAQSLVLEAVGPSMAPLYVLASPGDELELEANAGATLRGEAVLATGQGAVAEATLTLEASLPVSGGERRQAFVRSHTFGSGGFELSYVPAGQYELRIEADGVAPWRDTVRVAVGERVELGRIELAALGSVRGQVRDSYGSPVAGARVEEVGGGGAEAVTDADGGFVLSPVAAGAARVRAVHWLIGKGEGEVVVESGAEGRVELRLSETLDGGGPAWPEALAAQGVALERDEGGYVVSLVAEDSPWSDSGLERGDHVESLGWRGSELVSVSVVRDGGRRTLRR